MAAAYRSHTTVSQGSRTNTTFTAPSGIVDNDILVIVMSAGNTTSLTVTAPTGFSTATGFPIEYGYSSDPNWKVRFYAFYKVASGESGTYTATHSTGTTEGVMYAVSGGNTTTPINPAPTTQVHTAETSGATVTAPSITPAVNDSWIVWFGGSWDDFGAASPPTGTTPTFTERFNPTSASVFYVADGVLATAAATGSKSVTCAQSNARQNAGAMVCVEAAAGGATAWGPLLGLRNNRLVQG